MFVKYAVAKVDSVEKINRFAEFMTDFGVTSMRVYNVPIVENRTGKEVFEATVFEFAIRDELWDYFRQYIRITTCDEIELIQGYWTLVSK